MSYILSGGIRAEPKGRKFFKLLNMAEFPFLLATMLVFLPLPGPALSHGTAELF